MGEVGAGAKSEAKRGKTKTLPELTVHRTCEGIVRKFNY